MKSNSENWLKHLAEAMPKSVRGLKISLYALALEGWRRGLTLKFISYKPGTLITTAIIFSLGDENNEYTFTVTKGSFVSSNAVSICKDKSKTYEVLRKNNIPIPEGRKFDNTNTDEEIASYADSLGFPLVIKPTDSGGGMGVITNIKNIKEFNKALSYVKGDLNRNNIVVERFFKGVDYRIYVVGGNISGVLKFYTTNIIGDGQHTINQLIEIKNNIKKKHPIYFDRPIKVDEALLNYLSEQRLTLDSIPDDGKRILLRHQGTYINEREPADITDELSEKLKQYCIAAIAAIDGLHHGSIDMIVNEEEKLGVINEINSRPQISMHLFPMEGKARDIPKDIIDFYFPETKNMSRNDDYHFDLKSIIEILESGYAKEVIVPKISKKELYTNIFKITGDLLGPIYMKWVKRQAIRLNIIGNIKKDKHGTVNILASGTRRELQELEKILTEKATKRALIKQVEGRGIFKSTKAKKIGFEII